MVLIAEQASSCIHLVLLLSVLVVKHFASSCTHLVLLLSVLVVKHFVAARGRCALALLRVHSQADGQWLHCLKGAIAGISVALDMQGSLSRTPCG